MPDSQMMDMLGKQCQAKIGCAGLRSSRHQRNRHQEVDSPPTNNSAIINTFYTYDY